MTHAARLRSAAQDAQAVLARVADGVVAALDEAPAEVLDALDEASTQRLIAALDEAAETSRRARELIGDVVGDALGSDAVGQGAAWLADHALPFNRKERFFTGTVLPMLVCGRGFAHLTRLASMCGLAVRPGDVAPDGANVQFFTEYGFAESVMGSVAGRFPDAPTGRDTPDVIVFIAGPRPRLLAIEAKLFDLPSRAELNAQLAAQRIVLDYLAAMLDVAPGDVAHVALVPEQLVDRVSPLDAPIVTWQRVADTFGDVAPSHWLDVLRTGLDRYDDLVTTELQFGLNMDGRLRGEEIVERFHAGTLDMKIVGRNGGLRGATFAADVESGRWRTFEYECSRSQTPPNRNWFTVAEFVAAVAPPAAHARAQDP